MREVQYFSLKRASDSETDVELFNAGTNQTTNQTSGRSTHKRAYFLITIGLIVSIVCVATIYVTLNSNSNKVVDLNQSKYSDPVETECGPITGVKETIQPGNKVAYSFKGIPYAKPPVGSLRWSAPVRLSQNKSNCWKGSYNAHNYGSSCVQDTFGTEDCLFLNIHTPTLNKSANLPVFVWIHGGYLMTGNGSQTGYYPGSEFALNMNVVGVSMNYRLNAFGFLTLKELWKNNTSYGNFGLLDQILVLQWVKDNIKKFGGNPNSVLVSGQSSGGTSIFALLASPAADSLFHKAISMSGSPKFEKSHIEASKDNKKFIEWSKRCKSVPQGEQLRQCLYQMTSREVIASIPRNVFPFWDFDDLVDFPTYKRLDGALIVVDGLVVKISPEEIYKLPRKTNVSVLIGNTAQEAGIEQKHIFSGPNQSDDLYNFLKTRLDPFSKSFTNQLWDEIYSNETIDIINAQKLFESMITDVRITCPSNKFASDMARNPTLQVYRYVVENAPEEPGVSVPLIPTRLHNAFHVWDAAALFDFKMFTPYGYNVTSSDRVFTKTIRNVVSNFIRDSNLESKQWEASQTGVFQADGSLRVQGDYHKTICKFWNDANNGFVPYRWIN